MLGDRSLAHYWPTASAAPPHPEKQMMFGKAGFDSATFGRARHHRWLSALLLAGAATLAAPTAHAAGKAIPKAPTSPQDQAPTEDADGACPAGTSLHRTKTERYCYHPSYNKEGAWVFWYDSGQKKTETWYKNGKRDGKRLAWYENAQKKEECQFKDDQEEGKCLEWYKDGKKKSEVDYKNGKKHGHAVYFDSDGKKTEESGWKDGGRHGPTTWYFADGKKKEEYEHKDGKREGQHTVWMESGKKKYEERYISNRLEGLHVEYTVTGKFQSATCFRDNTVKWKTDDEAESKSKACN